MGHYLIVRGGAGMAARKRKVLTRRKSTSKRKTAAKRNAAVKRKPASRRASHRRAKPSSAGARKGTAQKEYEELRTRARRIAKDFGSPDRVLAQSAVAEWGKLSAELEAWAERNSV